MFNYAEWLAECKGRTLFRMNLDETAICLYPGIARGAVFVSKKRAREDRALMQHVPFAKRRCYVSYVSIVCDRADIQPLLPQFLVANERTLLRREVDALVRAAPANVVLWRRRSAWSTAQLTARIVGSLSNALRALRARLPDAQPVLIFDAAKIHLHALVLRACKAAGIWVLVVPPRMTFVLQPLDAHVFARFKGAILVAYQEARLKNAATRGDICITEWFDCIFSAIAKVINARGWAAAFDHCGLGAQQTALGRRTQRTLGFADGVEIPALPPPDDVVRKCFPRRFKIDMQLYWSLFDDVVPQRPLLRRARPLGEATRTSVRELTPWRAPRTRAEHREASAAAEAVARLAGLESAAGDAPPRPLLRRYRGARALDAD